MRHAGHFEPFLGRRLPIVTLGGAIGGSTADALSTRHPANVLPPCALKDLKIPGPGNFISSEHGHG